MLFYSFLKNKIIKKNPKTPAYTPFTMQFHFGWKQKRQLRFRSQSRIRKSKTLYLIFKMMQFNFYQKKTKSMNEWDPHVYHLLDRQEFLTKYCSQSQIFFLFNGLSGRLGSSGFLLFFLMTFKYFLHIYIEINAAIQYFSRNRKRLNKN
jgi:hypothetical protein